MKFAKTKVYDDGLKKLFHLGDSALSKLQKLRLEIEKSPRKGIGYPEQLKGYHPRIVWSRRIIGKHRLVYEISGDLIIFLSCYGHYKDH